MSKQPAFWGLELALVPLCLHESTSRQAHAQLRKFPPVVWWGVRLKFTVPSNDCIALVQINDYPGRQ